MEWDSEALLSEELYRLRKCSVESILYLTARDDILLERKKADTTRARFSFKIEHFHAFRGWYSQTLNVRIFDVSDFSAENLKIVVLDWIQEHATNI
jgi:hypothetical protein